MFTRTLLHLLIAAGCAACVDVTPTAPGSGGKRPGSALATDETGNSITVMVDRSPGSNTCQPATGELGLRADVVDGRGYTIWEARFGDVGYPALSAFTIPIVIRDSTAEHLHFRGYHWAPGGLPQPIEWRTGFVDKDFYYIDQGGYMDLGGNGQACRLTVTWTHVPPPPIVMFFPSPRYDTLPPGTTANYTGHNFAADGYTEVFSSFSPTWWTVYSGVATVSSSGPGTGAFPLPIVWVTRNGIGTTILTGRTQNGVTGGAEITSQASGSGGGGCPPMGC